MFSRVCIYTWCCDWSYCDCAVRLSHYDAVDAINGYNHVASHHVLGDTYGMAVNAQGDTMAVTTYVQPLYQVYVFQLVPVFKQLCGFGRHGTGPSEFRRLRRLCFSADDTILVCDMLNDRLHQFTVAGEFVSAIAVQRPFAVAASGGIAVVGRLDGPIETYSLSTGELIHCFGSAGPGKIGSYATGICCSPDGGYIICTECASLRLSFFTMDGYFMKYSDVDALASGWKDVTVATGGEIIVADVGLRCLHVLSPDGNILLKTWGESGKISGCFEHPRSLAISGSTLYVLDETRVHMFE